LFPFGIDAMLPGDSTARDRGNYGTGEIFSGAPESDTKMQAPKRRKIEYDYREGLAAVLRWLEDRPYCGTSHLALTCVALKGNLRIERNGRLISMRTQRADVSLNNLKFFESLGACRYELCEDAAGNDDVVFLNKVLKTDHITFDLVDKIIDTACRLDSVELLLWAQLHTSELHQRNLISKALKHSATKILDVVANRGSLSQHVTDKLKSFKWLEEHFPECTEPYVADEMFLDMEVDLLDHLKQIGWEIPYRAIYKWSEDPEVIDWLRLHTDVPLEWEFDEFIEIPSTWDFERFCQYHAVDYASYRKMGTQDERDFWVKRDLTILPVAKFYRLHFAKEGFDLGDLRPKEPLTPALYPGLDLVYSVGRAKKVCEQPWFNRGDLRYLLSHALLFATKEVCEYYHSLDLNLPIRWPDIWNSLPTAEETIAKAEWLYSLQPLDDAVLSLFAMRNMNCYTLFGWVVEKISKENCGFLMLKLNAEYESDQWFGCFMRLYPKYPHLSKKTKIQGFELNSKEQIEFVVKWKLKVYDPSAIFWPDDFEFFSKHIDYFEYVHNVVDYLAQLWTEGNYQKLLKAKARGIFRYIMS
jgi:hypothetical protein